MLAGAENASLAAQFASISLKPNTGMGREEYCLSGVTSTVSQVSQTDLYTPGLPCSVDVEVQCSPITVDEGTTVTDCSVVNLIAFMGQILFVSQPATIELLLLLPPFYDPLSGTTQVSRYQKDKPFWWTGTTSLPAL